MSSYLMRSSQRKTTSQCAHTASRSRPGDCKSIESMPSEDFVLVRATFMKICKQPFPKMMLHLELIPFFHGKSRDLWPLRACPSQRSSESKSTDPGKYSPLQEIMNLVLISCLRHKMQDPTPLRACPLICASCSYRCCITESTTLRR